jgi:hypothetical protein
MGKIIQFPKSNSRLDELCGSMSKAVASLLSTLADQQFYTAKQLDGLLNKLENVEKSLVKTGVLHAPGPSELMEQARTIELLIDIARQKLSEIRPSQTLRALEK